MLKANLPRHLPSPPYPSGHHTTHVTSMVNRSKDSMGNQIEPHFMVQTVVTPKKTSLSSPQSSSPASCLDQVPHLPSSPKPQAMLFFFSLYVSLTNTR